MADSVAGGSALDDLQAAPASHSTSRPVTEESNAKSSQLADLIARATAAYAIKDYAPAAELYSQATELQADLNGEMAIENADLLYSYGKCLYYVAVSKSDVLGGSAASAKLGPDKTKSTGKKRKRADASLGAANGATSAGDAEVKPVSLAKIMEEGAADMVPEADAKPKDDKSDKPFFQFTGDENWDNSDEGEDEDDGADAEPDEEEDDFMNAYEVLDLSRILLLRKLDLVQQNKFESAKKGKYVPSVDLTPEVREVKDRIADVHDLQAEISLEGEKFANAVVDLKASLVLKEELYPVESSVLAECHYKLSLALEFSAVKQNFDASGNPLGEPVIDETLRAEAAQQMEKAIGSCKLRIKTEQNTLHEMAAKDPKQEKLRKEIDDVQEMVEEMQQRLFDLRKPTVSVKEAGAKLDATENPVSGIMSQILGESKETQKKILEDAARGATDLSGLVKRKKPKTSVDGEGTSASATPEPSAQPASSLNGKRKVELAEVTEEIGTGKKARVEDAEDDV